MRGGERERERNITRNEASGEEYYAQFVERVDLETSQFPSSNITILIRHSPKVNLFQTHRVYF